MSTPSIPLITSLSPKGNHDIQRAAVASWLELGLKVVSANTLGEIASLRPLYPDVTFHTVTRTAQAQAKKPVPLIDDMLAVHADSPEPFMLINADIILSPAPETLRAAIASARDGALICGGRLDVDDAIAARAALRDGLHPTGDKVPGYDFFIVPPTLPMRLPRTRLAIGMPFWDYWLPLAAHLSGAPLKELAGDFALHSRHDAVWHNVIYPYFSIFLSAILDQFSAAHGGGSLRERLAEQMLRYEHAMLNERVRAADSTDQEATTLSEFYDRQHDVLVYCMRAAMTPLEL